MSGRLVGNKRGDTSVSGVVFRRERPAASGSGSSRNSLLVPRPASSFAQKVLLPVVRDRIRSG